MKIARLQIHPEILMYMGSGTFKVIGNALPPDAQLRQTVIDPITGAVQLFIESQEFADIENCCVPPLLHAPVISRVES